MRSSDPKASLASASVFVPPRGRSEVVEAARKRREIREFPQPPSCQAGVCASSQVWSNYTRQLIISQLASIIARHPDLVLKNQKTERSRFNDPRISAGFTGSGFLPRPLDKSLLAACRGGTEFVKTGGTMLEGNESCYLSWEESEAKETSAV